MRIERGFPQHQRRRVAELFWQAFHGKLGRVMAPEAKALAFIEDVLTPDFALSACDEQTGSILGVAGFKTTSGGLISAGYHDLAKHYGRIGALWRGPMLDILDRPLKPAQLLLDGLFVEAVARNRGVGSALIDAIVAEARERRMRQVRLDVVDTNLRARALYERNGFVPTDRVELGIFSPVFGFHHATTMCRDIE